MSINGEDECVNVAEEILTVAHLNKQEEKLNTK